MKKALRIHVNGIVQGVGFRPFVYRIAHERGIKGWVKNSGNGVVIHAEGNNTEEFFGLLRDEAPPQANIIWLDKKEVPVRDYQDFQIIESETGQVKDVLISPDIKTCADCKRELSDKADRRYRYPFINCTNCGPRYTIIRDRPYDRDKTTMASFSMCPECLREYENPLDRRFHAQPVACPDCGPSLRLLDRDGRIISSEDAGAKLLEEGAILAVKGLGGFHLVCDACNDSAVRKLRELKERGKKPFALMVRNLEIAAKEVYISELEKQLLDSPAAPIVILVRKNRKSKISPDVAPGLCTLGIMLPYTPVHYLLFESRLDFLVMTSANLSGRPLIYKDDKALEELKEIADYFLVHDREIYHPCDDSVVQVVRGRTTFIRRARGYVPLPLFLAEAVDGSFVALGGEMNNAFCLAAGKTAFMSQYIGDMHSLENVERFQQELLSFQKVANIFPDRVAYDLHPEYATTRIAKEMGLPKYKVQHHHAHLVSVMGEYGIKDPALGIICDGTGYGEDGRIWGFEFLYGNAGKYDRKGHLEYLPLPGGDAGTRKPLRIAYAYLKQVLAEKDFLEAETLWKNLSREERTILDAQLAGGFQVYLTSSAGRLFDAVSAILGICTEVTYQGQAAIELESKAVSWLREINERRTGQEEFSVYDFEGMEVRELKKEASARIILLKELLEEYGRNAISSAEKEEIINRYARNAESLAKNLFPFEFGYKAGVLQLKPGRLLKSLVREVLEGSQVEKTAFRFHLSLACAILEAALLIKPDNRDIFLGGGVFHNKLLTEMLLDLAGDTFNKIYYPVKLPPGDGGLALGQVLIADSAQKRIN